jgi:hypothetical protein
VQCLVDHGSANPSPLICVLGTEDYEVNRNAKITEGFAKAHELRSATFHLGLYDEQIQIAVGASLAPGAGTKEDHLGVGGGSGEATARLGDQGLIGYSHDIGIVAVACGGSWVRRGRGRFRASLLDFHFVPSGMRICDRQPTRA